MKKLITLISIGALMAVASIASAQVAGNQKQLTGLTVSKIDTVTNTASKVQSIVIAGYNDVVTFNATIKKISGTVGGSILLQGSVDGTNYVTIGSAATPTDVTTQTFEFLVKPSSYSNYQIKYTGATTQVSSFTSWALWRKQTFK